MLLFLETPDQPVGPIKISDVTQDSATLAWKPPRNDGGSPITGYNIEYRESRRGSWTKAGSVDKDTTSWTQSKLQEDNEYIFRVTAVNKKGESSPLEAQETIKPLKPLGKDHQNVLTPIYNFVIFSGLLVTNY